MDFFVGSCFKVMMWAAQAVPAHGGLLCGQGRAAAHQGPPAEGSAGAATATVEGFQLADGSTVTGDLYVSAMPGMRPLHTLCNTITSARHVPFRVLQLGAC